jgi:uncharacterized protein (TIGR03435 family)
LHLSAFIGVHRRPITFFIFAATIALAQTPTARPSFEAASIKVFDESQQSGSLNPNAEGLTAHNLSVAFLIQWAWNVKPYELSIPNALKPGMDSPHYDIVARAAGPVSNDQLRLMTQSLLIDRFHLSVHNEKRDIPVFALITAKDGPKQLHPPASPDDSPHVDLDSKNQEGGQHWLFHNEPAGAIGGILSNGLDRPIVDMTALAGKFDYTFILPPWNRAEGPLGDHIIANVFPELQRQLGLRIEARTAPADVLVIDRIDKTPTEN